MSSDPCALLSSFLLLILLLHLYYPCRLCRGLLSSQIAAVLGVVVVNVLEAFAVVPLLPRHPTSIVTHPSLRVPCRHLPRLGFVSSSFEAPSSFLFPPPPTSISIHTMPCHAILVIVVVVYVPASYPISYPIVPECVLGVVILIGFSIGKLAGGLDRDVGELGWIENYRRWRWRWRKMSTSDVCLKRSALLLLSSFLGTLTRASWKHDTMYISSRILSSCCGAGSWYG